MSLYSAADSSEPNPLESRISTLTHELAAHRRYSQILEGMLREHNIPLPHEEHPVTGLAQVIHYREGYWPTKYELDMDGQTQHLVVGKKLSHLSACIVNSKGQTVAASSIPAFGEKPPKFKFELLCKPNTMETFETIRVPTTGKAMPLRELIAFEHGSPVNIDDGSFVVNDSRWMLRFKPIISSGCPRKAPKLFKIRVSPIFDEEYCRSHSRSEWNTLYEQLTVETEPFRSVLRNYESKALQNFRDTAHNQINRVQNKNDDDINNEFVSSGYADNESVASTAQTHKEYSNLVRKRLREHTENNNTTSTANTANTSTFESRSPHLMVSTYRNGVRDVGDVEYDSEEDDYIQL